MTKLWKTKDGAVLHINQIPDLDLDHAIKTFEETGFQCEYRVNEYYDPENFYDSDEHISYSHELFYLKREKERRDSIEALNTAFDNIIDSV